MESMYQEIILDHYKNPQGRGLREPFDAEVFHVNPMCGDELTLRVQMEGESVKDISYDGQGCSISQAAASVLYEEVAGKTLPEALSVTEEFTKLLSGKGEYEPDEDLIGDGVAFAGVAKYPARIKCGLLAWMAFQDAVGRRERSS